MGTPVVIAENGLGAPVTPVEGGAPILTIAENGLGVPIVIAENSAPFVVEGWPPISDPPENMSLPTITGTAQVGETLTADPGAWTNEPDSYAYQWLRGAVAMPGATSSTYVPVEADVGSTISLQVIATNAGGDSAPATSAPTSAVIAAFSPPVNTSPPVITGTAQVGVVLSTSTGTWTGNPTPTLTIQWQKDSVDIPGATSSSYTPVAEDVGGVIRVEVTGANSEGNSVANSAATDPVVPAEPASPFSPATVTAGVSEFGDTGYYSTVYGSISAEPLPGYPVLELATRNEGYTQVAFTGDCLSIVDGWEPIIDGVTITGVISAWAFDGSDTTATWDSTGDMVSAESYPITWKRSA